MLNDGEKVCARSFFGVFASHERCDPAILAAINLDTNDTKYEG